MNPQPNESPRAEVRTDVAGVIVATVLFVGGALAVDHFFKVVRHSSTDKAVLGNVRQLAAAADQYYLENAVTAVAITSLVGPTNYLKALHTVAGESYPATFVHGRVITATGIGGARTVTYAP